MCIELFLPYVCKRIRHPALTFELYRWAISIFHCILYGFILCLSGCRAKAPGVAETDRIVQPYALGTGQQSWFYSWFNGWLKDLCWTFWWSIFCQTKLPLRTSSVHQLTNLQSFWLSADVLSFVVFPLPLFLSHCTTAMPSKNSVRSMFLSSNCLLL